MLFRSPQGLSSLADANLRLQGPQNNLLLSGNVQVTRFAINSDLDIAALASQTTSVQPIVAPDAPSNHLRLDVHLTSAPQLNFQNAYAKLAGDVDLHLRGTLASPSLLGRISLTEGSTSISGTRYELQRGDIVFNNPVRIQPNIDIDATARVEDYDITLGLHGSSDKPRLTQQERYEYYTDILKRRPQLKVEQRVIHIGCNMANDTGLYMISFNGKEKVPGRYSITYQFIDGQWLIVAQHTALMPEKH